MGGPFWSAFDAALLISHISHFMTLLPGDVIATAGRGPAGLGE